MTWIERENENELSYEVSQTYCQGPIKEERVKKGKRINGCM